MNAENKKTAETTTDLNSENMVSQAAAAAAAHNEPVYIITLDSMGRRRFRIVRESEYDYPETQHFNPRLLRIVHADGTTE